MIKWLWFQLLVSSYPFQELVWLILAGIQSKLSRQFINQKKSTITITSSMNKLVFENTTFAHTHMMCTQEKKKREGEKKNKTKNPTVTRVEWCRCTRWLCPGCHGGGTGEAGTGGEAAFGRQGRAHPSHSFLWQRHSRGHENTWCLASLHWCEGPGKHPAKRPSCAHLSPSQNGTGTLNTAAMVQRGTQNGTTEQLSTQVECMNIKEIQAATVPWLRLWAKPPMQAVLGDGPLWRLPCHPCSSCVPKGTWSPSPLWQPHP